MDEAARPFENVEPEFAHLVTSAVALLNKCRMGYDPDKEMAAAASLRAASGYGKPS